MASTSMDYEAPNGDRYEGKPVYETSMRCQIGRIVTNLPTEDAPRYERDNRSASPRANRDEAETSRRRSASPPHQQAMYVCCLLDYDLSC